MDNFQAIIEHLRTLDNAGKVKFYFALGFNLTVSVRSVWSDPLTTDKEKLDGIKAINELSHNVFNWLARLKDDEAVFDDLACFRDVKNSARQNDVANGEIGNAILRSYERFLRR
jgi:hypothetical protein